MPVEGETPALRYAVIEAPTGSFYVGRTPSNELRCGWLDRDDDSLRDAERDDTIEPALRDRISAFFAGTADDFADLPIPAGPAFHRACWRAARAIPRGETITYGELARRAGSPGGARAAGQAMRRNPVPVLVPCHRVVASNGLGGFSGATGSDAPEVVRKRCLLDLESAGHA